MNQRRSAYTIVIAVVVIGAFGTTLALVGGHFVGMTRSARSATLDVRAAQLAASGQEWAAANAERLDALEEGEELVLNVGDLVPRGLIAALTIRVDQAAQTLQIRARVRHGRQAAAMMISQPMSGER